MADAPFTLDPSSFAAGDKLGAGSSSFSTTPTVAEINSSSALNQIIAIVNRRSDQVWVGLSHFNYVTAGSKLSASLLQDLQTRINLIATGVAMSAYSWSKTYAVSDKWSQLGINEIRNNLTFISGLTVINFPGTIGTVKEYTRRDSPYGTFVSQTSSLPPNNQIGKSFPYSAGSTDIGRSRIGFWFPIPTGLGDASAICYVNIICGGWISTLESFNPQIYSSDTDDHSSTGVVACTNLDHAEGMGTYGSSSDQQISIDKTHIEARAGSYLSCIIGNEYELAGTGIGYNGDRAQRASFTVSSQTISLTLDFGFRQQP